jgi:hypothetical protein
MKKVVAFALVLTFLCEYVSAQKNNRIRPAALGLSFILNDYTTAERIRNTSLSTVRREDQWTPFSQQSPGLALHYFRGLNPNIDFAATLGASYVRYSLGNQTNTGSDELLLEADASANFKLFSEDYVVTPYFISGVGASKYGSSWGAFVPLGAGLKINLYNEADVFFTFQYRVPVTKETAGYHFLTSIGISGLLGKGNTE